MTTTTMSSISVLSNNLLLARQQQQQQQQRRNGVIITRRRKFNSGVRIQSALFGGGQGLKKTPEQKNKLKRLEKLNPGNNEQEEEFWPEDLKQLRTPIMAGNWKCNPKTLEEARTLASLVAANTAEDRRESDFFNDNERGGGGRSGFNLFNKRNANNNRGGGRGDNKNVEVLICPPAAFLSEVSQLVRFLIYRFFSRGSTQRVTEKRARVKILVPLLRIEAGSNYLLLLKRYFSCHSYSDSLLL